MRTISPCCRRAGGLAIFLGAWFLAGCSAPPRDAPAGDASNAGPPKGSRTTVQTTRTLAAAEEFWAMQRRHMVDRQIRSRGVADEAVLNALAKVERHRFVPEPYRLQSYNDGPLPIGEGQTISQPYIVALMTELLRPKPGQKVLEVGTGSGYQAAVLAEIVGEVYTIEIIESLGRTAEKRLKDLGYKNVHVRIGDGYKGWPEVAPFDGIMVTAAPEHVPQPLVDQLKVGGRLVLPVGKWDQRLEVLTKTKSGAEISHSIPVRFVPMTGEALKKER